MADSTLVSDYADLQSEVGFFLGYGRGAAAGDLAWTEAQERTIDAAVREGLRRFYFFGHPWSFLRPVGEFKLLSGQSTIACPPDWGGHYDPLIVKDSGSRSSALRFGLIGSVYRMHAERPDVTGRPVMVCEEPWSDPDHSKGQRFRLHFWPAADGDYTVQVQYYLAPDALSGTLRYAYGGPQFAQARIDACLAAAELQVDGQAGPRERAWQQSVAAAVVLDSRNKPMNLGRNTTPDWDGSVWEGQRITRVTYNGSPMS
jgi:hypothetical protein